MLARGVISTQVFMNTNDTEIKGIYFTRCYEEGSLYSCLK